MNKKQEEVNIWINKGFDTDFKKPHKRLAPLDNRPSLPYSNMNINYRLNFLELQQQTNGNV